MAKILKQVTRVNSPLTVASPTDAVLGNSVGAYAQVVEVSSSGAGATNLAYTAAVGNGLVTSDTGTDATITAVDGTNAGLMLPAHKVKVDHITVTQAVNLDTMETDIAAKQQAILIQDEGVQVGGAAGYVDTINFVGSGVAVTDATGGNVTVTIAGGTSIAHDALTQGAVTVSSFRLGGTATTISTPAAGEYNLVVQSGAFMQTARIFGNNTVLNGSNEFIVRVNNSANSLNRTFNVQLYDANNGALVDQQVTSTNHTQTVGSNITVLTFPGMNGFGATGFYIELR